MGGSSGFSRLLPAVSYCRQFPIYLIIFFFSLLFFSFNFYLVMSLSRLSLNTAGIREGRREQIKNPKYPMGLLFYILLYRVSL